MRARLCRYTVSSLLAVSACLGVSTVRAAPDDSKVQTASQEPFQGTRSLVGSYLAGRLARSQNDTESAANFYRTALARDPSSELLMENAFQMEAMEGASKRAFDLAERLISVEPKHRTARLFIGLKEFKAGHFRKAEQHFRAASNGPIGELTGSMARAWVELAAGNTNKALEALNAPRQAQWAQFYLRYHRALISDLAGRREDAAAAFGRVFRRDPKALRTTLAYVRHAAHAGDFKLARSILKEHIKSNGGEAHPLVRRLVADVQARRKVALLIKTPSEGLSEAFYGLGEALIGEGAVPAGMLYMQMALSVVPKQQFALAALANAYESSRRYEDAIEVYDRIEKGSPLEFPIEIRKAYNLNSLDRVIEALRSLETLLNRIKTLPPASLEEFMRSEQDVAGDISSDAPLKIGSKGKLVRELQEALAKLGHDVGEPDGRFGASTHAAVIDFQKGHGLKEDGLVGPATYAAVMRQLEPPAEQPSVGFAPSLGDHLQVLDALGSIQRARKLYTEATETYTQAINLLPENDKRHWTYFYARGTSYERLKNWPSAEADLEKALELAPEQPLVLNYLGYSWIDQGMHLKKGMALIEKAVALKPDDGYIVDSLGWAHYKLGNYKEAVRYLERAVELKPDDPILNDHLGDALWRTGREREARFQWDQALSLEPEPEDIQKIKKKLADGLDGRAQAVMPEKKTTEVQPTDQP